MPKHLSESILVYKQKFRLLKGEPNSTMCEVVDSIPFPGARFQVLQQKC